MTLDDIETAVGLYLTQMDDAPDIAWPNKSFTPSGDYIEFRHAPNEKVDDTISGGYSYQIGLFLLTVVTERDKFTRPANQIAQAIIDRFPKALRIGAGGGDLVITKPTSPRSGFVDGVHWRQPLVISYITEGNGKEFAPHGSATSFTTTGWAAYSHTGAVQNVAADTETVLVNDAGNKNESQKPYDVADLYDGSVVTGRTGDSIILGVEFTFTPSDGQASSVNVSIDIGGAVGKIYPEDKPLAKGENMPHRISYHPPAYTLDTWQANGGAITINADGPGTVSDVRYVIHRLHKAR